MNSTCVVSILRLQSLYVVSHTDDISWNNPLAAIWSSTELNVGIICSCLPTIKGWVTKIFPGLFPSLGSTRGASTSGQVRSRDRRQQSEAQRKQHDRLESVHQKGAWSAHVQPAAEEQEMELEHRSSFESSQSGLDLSGKELRPVVNGHRLGRRRSVREEADEVPLKAQSLSHVV